MRRPRQLRFQGAILGLSSRLRRGSSQQGRWGGCCFAAFAGLPVTEPGAEIAAAHGEEGEEEMDSNKDGEADDAGFVRGRELSDNEDPECGDGRGEEAEAN